MRRGEVGGTSGLTDRDVWCTLAGVDLGVELCDLEEGRKVCWFGHDIGEVS